MKKIIGFLFNKITIAFILILIQIFWFILFFVKLAEYTIWLTVLFSLVSIAMFLAVIVSNQNPAYKIGWITIIAVLPVLGGLFYLFMGNKRPSRFMKRRLSKANKRLEGFIGQDEMVICSMSKRLSMTANYIYESMGFPINHSTSATYFDSGEGMYESMLIDLKNAQKFIFFEFFIVSKGEMWDSIKKILIEKSKLGIDVRMIFDDFGCIKAIDKKTKKELKDAGIKILMFNPIIPIISLVMNHRDHRKILIIDGNIGYTGGINIADEYINKKKRFGHWKDSGIRLRGEGVKNFTLMFLRLFYAYVDIDEDPRYFIDVNFKDCEYIENKKLGLIQAFSDSPMDDESTAENLYLDILWQAKDYIYIFTPYLIIDDELNTAICMAAKRGVDVRIVVPGIADKKMAMQLTKSYFKQLILAGVKIYRYTHGFIHAKSFLCDDKIAIVGTINMDFRSLYLHFECGVMIIDNPILEDIKKDCLSTFDLSHKVSITECDKGELEHILRAVLRLASPLF